MGGLKILAAAVLNGDNPEFFDKLMKDGVDAVEPEMRRQKAERMKESKNKRITDEQGIIYEEVSYQKYLTSKNKHRIVKSLESQYFVEIDACQEKHDE